MGSEMCIRDSSYSEDNGFLVGYNVNAYSADSKSYNLMRASSTSEKGNYTKSASSFRRFMVRPSVEYANTFGKHAVSALFLYEQTQLKGSTMTGKMVYPIVDKFVVQWEEQKKVYPKAVNLGSIF